MKIENLGPVLKWAGGKTQLWPTIKDNLPKELETGAIDTYIEPFFGGGAVFFNLLQEYEFKNTIILDYNRELVLLYKVIQQESKKLIKVLGDMEEDYLSSNEDSRKSKYYAVRDSFNESSDNFDFDNLKPKAWVARAAQVIFLNRTCFNGLFRVNKKGYFNVPQGSYKNPQILNTKKIEAIAKALKDVTILRGDFSLCEEFVTDKTFLYYDPPYRPLNVTSNFNAYATSEFNDDEQTRLGKFFADMSERGAKQLLSNSDPKNENKEDNFFDDLYSDFDIQRVAASRRINSKASQRGDVMEILVKNY